MRGRVVRSCHMIADTLEELHAMADRIGLKREWFQERSFPHYDLIASRRERAIRAGAVPLTMRGFVLRMRDLRGDNRC